MKIKILVILLGPLLILQNCAGPTVKITAVTGHDQKIYHDNEVTSEKRHAVSISYYKNLELIKSDTLFQIVVENRGEKPLFINNDNISVIFKGSSKGWTSKKISIQPLNEFMKDISDDYYYEEAEIIAHIITLLQLHAASEMDIEKAVNKVIDLRKSLSHVLNVIPTLILKPQPIKPHKSIMGIVACDTREIPEELEGHLQVALSIDGEDHKFTFSRGYE